MKTEKLTIIKRLSFLTGMILGIINCNTLQQGVIVEKWYELPNLKKISMYETTFVNNQIYKHNVNYLIKDGQDFCIKIKSLNKNNREKFRTIYLQKECWNSVSVGQEFKLSDKCYTYDNTLNLIPENSVAVRFH
ncbi:MAG: hypothetical protein U0W24_09795 [Bacteroidales bacterium]